MRITSLALAASLALSLTGAAFAQSTAAPAGSAERNMNNPGSVKSNSEKGMPETTGTAGSRMAPGTDGTMAPGATAPMAPGASTAEPMRTAPAR